jgi:D-arginine utilization repressor
MTIKPRYPAWLKAYVPTIEGIVALMHPYVEAVVHDIRKDKIVGIWNAYSGRQVGEASLLDDLPTEKHPMQGPYEKVALDGHRLSSVSSILVDPDNNERGLLCINFDRSAILDVASLLGSFAAPQVERPPELFERDWREQIALAVDAYCRGHQLRREKLTRPQRVELLRELENQGLFQTRNAAEHAGKAIGISRASVYALLKEARS